MNKIFYWLWSVVALFLFGLALVFTAAFTTKPTVFGGEADVELQFISMQFDKAVTPSLADEAHQPIAITADGRAKFKAKFESRDTNIFDTYNGGPHPRTAVVSFFELPNKHHEIFFRFDRHLKVWQAEIAFPDPSINDVQVEDSKLRFVRKEAGARVYEAVITAKALIGAPIIKND